MRVGTVLASQTVVVAISDEAVAACKAATISVRHGCERKQAESKRGGREKNHRFYHHSIPFGQGSGRDWTAKPNQAPIEKTSGKRWALQPVNSRLMVKAPKRKN
jgi:hypothetical protein